MSAYQGARLRHVGIRTDDVTRTANFYATVFGLNLLEESPADPSAVLGDGVFNLTIVPIVGAPNSAGPAVEGTEPIHLGFIVPDLLAAYRKCIEWGAEILAGNVSTREALPAGELPSKSFKVADPNGNVIDVVSDERHWAGVTL
jgi:catechol 2,3-dioxygenase-like lactoylglutathione lyase family enzyme